MTTTRDCKVRSGEVENNDKILHVCRGQQDLVLGATVGTQDAKFEAST